MPSIHDVAKRAGVSTATVSRTFGAPEKISVETRHRVMEAARALDYRPRGSEARSISEGKRPGGAMGVRTTTRDGLRPVRRNFSAHDTVGFQFFAAGNDVLTVNTFYAPVLFGVQAEAVNANLHILVHTTDRHTFAQELPSMVEQRVIGGLLLVGAADADVLKAFAKHVTQIVLVDSHDPTDAHDCILSDGFGGGYDTTRHLIELGHRRIAFLNPEREIGTFRDRQRGYLCALTEAGLPLDPALLLTGDASRYAGGETVEEFFTAYLRGAGKNAPTAIIAANDFFALQILQVCQALNWRVPADISIAGFDDGVSAIHCNPPLTTVNVDKEAMGRLALRRLQARLDEAASGVQTLPVARYQLPVRLVVRASTGAVAKGKA